MNNLKKITISAFFLFFLSFPFVAFSDTCESPCTPYLDLPTTTSSTLVLRDHPHVLASGVAKSLNFTSQVSTICASSYASCVTSASGTNSGSVSGSVGTYIYQVREICTQHETGGQYCVWADRFTAASTSCVFCSQPGPIPPTDVDQDGYPDRCDIYPGDPAQPESITLHDYIYNYDLTTGAITGNSCMRVTAIKGGNPTTKLIALTSGGCDVTLTAGPGKGKKIAQIPPGNPGRPITQDQICSQLMDFTDPYASSNILSSGEASNATSGVMNSLESASNSTNGVSINANGTVSGLPGGVDPIGGDYGNSTAVNQAINENLKTLVEQNNNATAKEAIEDSLFDKMMDYLSFGSYGGIKTALDWFGLLDTTLPAPEGYVDEPDLPYWFTFLETAAFNDIIEEVGIIASDGGCTYSGGWTFRGSYHSQTISFCGWESSLMMMGNYLVCIVCFHAVMIIFTGKQ